MRIPTFKSLYSALSALAFAAAFVAAPPASAGERVLRIASDVSYAPLEFYKPGTTTIVGFDYDLAQAIGNRLGVRVEFRNHDFGSIISRLKAGDYDLVISAMNDTRDRERDVDFVDYFLAGTGILAARGQSGHIYGVGDLCGRTVDVQSGTAQEVAIRKQQADCKAAGLGDVTILTAKTDDDALKQLIAGKSAAHVSDYPVVAYLGRTLDGGRAYRPVGRQFGIVPYGIAVAKTNHALRDRVQAALLDVVRDGTYDAILHKWSLEQGAMRSAPINAGPIYQR